MSEKHSKTFYFFQFFIRFLSLINRRRSQFVRRLFPTQWLLEGECNHCGACCEYPTIQVSSFYFKYRFFLRMMIRWHEYWYGFRYLTVREEHLEVIFLCTHLTDGKKCDDYSHRPPMCRDYPEIRTWFCKPDLFETCGYKAFRKSERDMQIHIDEFMKKNEALLDEARKKKEESKDSCEE